ncbi:MAG: vWA domain-containing protein [Candidatus Hydrogenedentota bacterium]
MYTRSMRVVVLLTAAAGLLGLVGCNPPIDALVLSNSEVNFELNSDPRTVQVWNENPQVGDITVTAEPSEPWISVLPHTFDAAAPAALSGPFNKERVVISVDRSRLPAGSHRGKVHFTAENITTVSLPIRVEKLEDPPEDGLVIHDMAEQYASPYLLDFGFAVKDVFGEPIVAERPQWEVTPLENDEPVSSDVPVFFRRGAARQLKLMLVLDYSRSMQQAGAIEPMEAAAKEVLLPTLNDDAQVGVVEFHSQFADFPPAVVVPLTSDKEAVHQGIDRIQGEFVNGFAGGAPVYDAVVTAAELLEPGDPAQEERIIVLFSDGKDVSRQNTIVDALAASQAVNARVYAVGFGVDTNVYTLTTLTGESGGEFFGAASTPELSTAFNEIVESLASRYVLRWATFRSTASQEFQPAFRLVLTGSTPNLSVRYEASERYDPSQYDSDPLTARMRFVATEGLDGTTAFLRADYMPPGISRLRFFLASETAFTVSIVGVVDDGLAPLATFQRNEAPDLGGDWFNLHTNDGPIPYAAFGALLRIDFDGFVPLDEPVFDHVYFDTGIYPESAPIRVIVEGYENTLPDAGESR